MHSLRSVRLTVRFLPGHIRADIEYTIEVAHCSPSTVREPDAPNGPAYVVDVRDGRRWQGSRREECPAFDGPLTPQRYDKARSRPSSAVINHKPPCVYA